MGNLEFKEIYITYQIAIILEGQIIGDNIKVYANNQNKSNNFYENFHINKVENNPIPTDISEGIDTNTIRYESFFIY